MLLTLGVESQASSIAFGSRSHSFQEIDKLLTCLLAARPAHVLVKGSRSMRMERVVQALLNSHKSQGGDYAA